MIATGIWWLDAGHWDVFVAVYLFLGGVSGGAYVAASIAEAVAGRSECRGYEHVNRWGLLTAFVAIAVGSITLLLHLSGPLLRAVTFPVSFTNWSSWMAIGTWVIVLFSLLVTVRLLWATFGAEATDDPSGLPRRPLAKLGIEDLLDRLADTTRPSGMLDVGVRLVGFGLAVLVVVYTGLLLGEVGWNVPLWDPRLLPLLFLASAVSAGTATVVLITQLTSDIDTHLVHQFSLFDDAVITVEIIILGVLLYTLATGGLAATETYATLTGTYGFLLWVGVIGLGLVAPLTISGAQQAVELVRDKNVLMTKRVCSMKFGLVILGSMLLRFLVVTAAVKQPILA